MARRTATEDAPLSLVPLEVRCTIAAHEALKADPAQWAQLPFVGFIHVDADEFGPAQTIVCRNCTACHSTLAREVVS